MPFPDPITDAQFYDGVRGRRVAAFAVDLMIILILLGGVAMIGLVIGFLTLGLGLAFIIPAFALTGILYRATMLSERSATLGMMLMGIELRDVTGERINTPTAVMHSAAFTAATYLTPVLLASLAWALMNPRGQMLHDALCGTVMINRPE
ncbi:MAG: RDD family protein [Pseudomonadota bacterium]